MSAVTTQVRDRVGWLVFNRPEKLNAFSPELLSQYAAAVDSLNADPDVSVLVIRGAGRAFSVGYDVAKKGSDSAAGGYVDGRVRALDDWLNLRDKIDLWLKVWRCPKPVIAAVHGYCLGGATMLAVCCDLTVVAADAVIGWPSVPLGAGLIGPVNAWLMGPKKAKEMSYVVGSRMSGLEAAELGWANHAVPADEVVGRADRLARVIARTPTELLQVKKRAINRVMDLQGFSEMVMFGAEFDAIAHDSAAVEAVREEIRGHGLKATIARFVSEEPSR
jgi:enoyl-CoA hydratase